MSARDYCPDPRWLGRSRKGRPIPIVSFAKGQAWALADTSLPHPFPMTLAEAQACAYCTTWQEQRDKLEKLRNPPKRTRRSRRVAAQLLSVAAMLGTRGSR